MFAHQVLRVRQAPGCASFDFGQSLFLQCAPATTPTNGRAASSATVVRVPSCSIFPTGSRTERVVGLHQDFQTPVLPHGSLLKVWCARARRGVLLRADGYGRLPLHTWWWRQFVFESSHGDRFYLGLNAIDLFDASGAPIRVPPHIVHALPHSVNDLLPPGADRDARIPSNLVAPLTSLEQRLDDRRAWLAPLAHSLHAGMVCMPPPHVLRAAVDMPTRRQAHTRFFVLLSVGTTRLTRCTLRLSMGSPFP